MTAKIIWNDMRQKQWMTVMSTVFMTASAALIALTVRLFMNLLTSMDLLMKLAETPDYLQMHTGTVDQDCIARFAEQHPEIRKWQICGFLNLENSQISLGGHNLADSTQDNGLYTQGQQFDYLLDLQNNRLQVSQGEVYVPVCYRSQYGLQSGDPMKIGNKVLTIAGFLRDSQMNSMLSSSKRFLVSAADYRALTSMGEEEYLIEFLLEDNADIDAFGTSYAAEGLPANGPAITKPLIRLMNALSDGMMILVIFLVSIVISLISVSCIYFVFALQMEKDKKEFGMLRAIGISKREIRKLYLGKYILLSGVGAVLGLALASQIQKPLLRQMQELYGVGVQGWRSVFVPLLAVGFVEGLILCMIRHTMKRREKTPVLEILYGTEKKRQAGKPYRFIFFVAAACVLLMVIPHNLYSTMVSPGFVTYMGIGDGEIRIDVRQTEEIDKVTEQLAEKLETDPRVETSVALKTKSYPAILADGTICNVTVETGNHTVFPVSYMEGTAPTSQSEIALSAANAKEWGLSVGDTIQLMVGEDKANCRICGIYSDITNGGKTAKAVQISDDTPAIWSVFYVSLTEGVPEDVWMEQYRQTGVEVVNIADYVEATYGQTLHQIDLAGTVAMGVALLIAFTVVTLFMRLTVERKRCEISLQRALGFTVRMIQKEYMIKGILTAAAGTVAGLIMGSLLGERICGLLLGLLGAYGFHFVIDWFHVLVFLPAVSIATAVAAVRVGISAVREVRAFECCVGKE